MKSTKEVIMDVLNRIEHVNDNPRSTQTNNYEEIDNVIQELRKEYSIPRKGETK